jgi:RNA polymerase primary sigma factor
MDYAHNDYNIVYDEILKMEPDLEHFVTYVRNIKAPQKKEPMKLLPQIKNGNMYARNRFFEMYLRIVLKMALHYHRRFKFSLTDTIQEGAIGLIIALDKYEYGSSDKFSTYAPWWIRQIIYRYMPLGNVLFDFPVHIKDKMFKICHILINKSEANKYLYHKQIVNRVCHILSCSKQKALKYISFFNTIFDIENIPDDITLLLSDNEEVISSIIEKTIDDLLAIQIKNILSTLPQRESNVIKLRYGIGFDKNYTLEEVGEKFGLTRERIRQIEKKAMRRLRHPDRSKNLRSFFGYEVHLSDASLPKEEKFLE